MSALQSHPLRLFESCGRLGLNGDTPLTCVDPRELTVDTSNPDDHTPEPAPQPNLTPEVIKTLRSACFGCAGQFLLVTCIGFVLGFFLARTYGWSSASGFAVGVFLTALLLYLVGKRAQAQPGSAVAIFRRTFRGLRRWPKEYSNRLFDKWGDSEPWCFKALNVAALFPAAIIWLGNNDIGKYWTKLLHLQDLLGWSRNPLYAGALTVFPNRRWSPIA